jgi:CO/xanthine dehydrogenase FAD-binding subunit
MLDAKIVTSERTLTAAEFMCSELRIQDVLRPGELVKEILIPKAAGVTHYDKERVRNAIDCATISLASRFVVEGGKIKEARVVFGGVAPLPYRVENVENYLIGKPVNEETVKAAAELAVEGACVMGKNEYKLHFMKSTLEKAILRAAN